MRSGLFFWVWSGDQHSPVEPCQYERAERECTDECEATRGRTRTHQPVFAGMFLLVLQSETPQFRQQDRERGVGWLLYLSSFQAALVGCEPNARSSIVLNFFVVSSRCGWLKLQVQFIGILELSVPSSPLRSRRHAVVVRFGSSGAHGFTMPLAAQARTSHGQLQFLCVLGTRGLRVPLHGPVRLPGPCHSVATGAGRPPTTKFWTTRLLLQGTGGSCRILGLAKATASFSTTWT